MRLVTKEKWIIQRVTSIVSCTYTVDNRRKPLKSKQNYASFIADDPSKKIRVTIRRTTLISRAQLGVTSIRTRTLGSSHESAGTVGKADIIPSTYVVIIIIKKLRFLQRIFRS